MEAQRDLIRYLLNAPGIVGGSEAAAEQRIHALAAANPIEGALAQAELLASHKKFDAAEGEYRKALDMKPERIGVYFEIAEYYRDRGDAARMSEVIEAGGTPGSCQQLCELYLGILVALSHRRPAVGGTDLP